MKHVLQRLYDSEINAGISWYWDGGFAWWCGDTMLREQGCSDTYDLAVEAVRQAAIRLYPESDFAKDENGRR